MSQALTSQDRPAETWLQARGCFAFPAKGIELGFAFHY
jgi:hypothetical protein